MMKSLLGNLQKKCILIVFSLSVSFLYSNFVLANDEGKQSYQACSLCHGTLAEGNNSLHAPVLAGQFDWYLIRQLENFQQGIRGSHPKDIHGKTMQPFAQSISEPSQVKAVSEYLSQLPGASTKGELSGDKMNGSRYYQAKCGACHGGQAQGNKAFNAPKLAGQSPEYLAIQMKNFKAGIRGFKPEDKLGRQMAMMATVVSDQELKDILFYIAEQE